MKYTLIKLFMGIYHLESLKCKHDALSWVYTILTEIDNMDFFIWLKWLDDSKVTTLETNTLFFEKVANNIRVVGDLDVENEDPFFIMSKEHFKDMIEQWVKKVENRRPPRVIIYWEDGKVRIETQDNWWAYVRNFFFNLWHQWKMKRFNKKMRKQQLLWQKKHEK